MLALVLPKTVLNGSSWDPTRKIIRDAHLLYVVASHEPNNWNFSESTELSEVLLVIHKTGNKSAGKRTVFINLWGQPKNSVEALALVRSVQAATPAKFGGSHWNL